MAGGTKRLKRQKKKILFFITEDWYFCSHRLALAIAAKNEGFEVCVVTRVQAHASVIESAGITLISINLDRRGRGLWVQIRTIFNLIKVYKSVRPDIAHHVGVMPVLYGSIAARCARVSFVVNALAGLGYIFSSKKFKAKIIRPFMKMAFRLFLNAANYKMILQNPDDQFLLCQSSILNRANTVLIRGSGVDVTRFTVQVEPMNDSPVILFASRMLWDKGVGVFVKTAEQLKKNGVKGRFVLVGDSDIGNQTAVSREQLAKWHEEGFVEWWGKKNDMVEVFSKVHIVCLPSSYGEGVPLVLIEAAASGKPIVTTDAPGCREIVRHGENGLLVPVKDADALASALKKLILSPKLREKMGLRGREIACDEFSIDKVIDETLSVYQEFLR